ncbi:HipA domain-containing protein [uncultured Roseobacter sp.]|uniref:HipA domain-containing protein n=1 Tax=uncultured Roseobacter sp. TaxID=114847 RepID=UPI00260953BD|nr:HipA domain-containing protein [uncultured Roseobacter sp.]
MLRLDVYLEGIADPVGVLNRADDGGISFKYRNHEIHHPISQSLPLKDGIFGDAATRGFFDNLLFENTVREQVMQKYGIDHTDIVGLLYHLGKDCPGSISVIPEGGTPAKQPGDLTSDYDPLTNEELTAIMKSLRDSRRMPEDTNDPSPLAGVQGKVAVTLLPNGSYALPRAGSGAPTTHILKVPRANEMRLVEHEHLLMSFANDLIDHPVAETKVVGEGDLRGLLITRYDRDVNDGKVYRIHQEDFCQALGLGPFLKYQRNGEGDRVFSAGNVGQLLSSCDVPAQARLAFFEGTIVNLLLGNTDNHAKNHSLLYNGKRLDRPQLAPFYDIVPTLIDDTVTHQLSFDIGDAKMTDDITLADLKSFTKQLGIRNFTAPMRERMGELIGAVATRIPDMKGPAHKRLGDAMAEQSKWFAKALKLEIDVPERDLIVINRP